MILQITNFSDPAFGRLGNQLFKFLFLKLAQQRLQCEIRTAPWLGNLLFNQRETVTPGPYDKQVILTAAADQQSNPNSDISTLSDSFARSDCIDVQGFFQYHSRHLFPFKELILNEFRINPLIMNQVLSAIGKITKSNNLVCLHIRRGDYINYPSHNTFWTTDIAKAVSSIQNLEIAGMSKPVVYICSDDLNFCKKEIDQMGINSITNRDLFIRGDTSLELIIDFTVQSISDVLMISNSSLSFFASMLNSSARIFLRPSPLSGEMLPFDPWNCQVLLNRI